MFLDDFLVHVDKIVKTYTIDAYKALASDLTPAFTVAFSLLIVLQGYKVYMGIGEHSVQYYARQVLLVGILGGLALNWDFFAAIIVHTVTDLPNEFVGALVAKNVGSADSMNKLFEQLYVDANEAFTVITEKGGWRNMWLWAIGISGYVVNTIMAAVIFFLLITTKIALSVLLVLAPFIVPMYMFPGPARDLCMGWARTLLTFMFIPILLYASCGLFVDVLEQHVEKIMADTANAESAFAYITITVICILFIRQVPSLAFGLTGGVSASDPGGSVYRGAKSALRGGGRLISKGLGLFKK